ncbi:MAG: YeeE/YedE family protein [Hyphomicrobiales bacterium]|nr:YeeE/YedE family protein [Hyphomicrobiales bacterium]MDE2114543.1 YeeE/YedE family protein [Hyphomicrobiales bacterium]
MEIWMYSIMPAIIGGVLIGAASVLLMALSGRIAGISGIAGGLMRPANRVDGAWRFMFVSGLIIGPILVQKIVGLKVYGAPTMSTPVLALAGLFVGVGTALSAGCTSGHGVCGIARLSKRSIAAVITFMTMGALTVYFIRHIL